MAVETMDRATQQLQEVAAKVADPAVREQIEALGDAIRAGNISGTGIALGRNIRMVVNQYQLPPEAIAALLDARDALGRSRGLDPDRFQLRSYIAEKAKGFVGRQFVFTEIDKFVANRPKGYFVIVADPGMGKSAIMANYVQRTGCISHFNVRSAGVVTAQQFLENVCTQLIVDYDLPYSTLPPAATQDGAFLARLLAEASAKLPPGVPLVIAVDALDEVERAGQRSGANILYLPAALPDGVYFILTRRPVDVPFVVQAPQHLLDLMQYTAENRRDVEFYLGRQAEHPRVRDWIDARGLTVAEFVSRLAELSDGNFMYLRYVLPEIEDGSYRRIGIADLPAGLEHYYEDHWQRMGMTARPLPRLKIRIVYILSEVRRPVSRALIAQFASSEGLPVDQVMVQEVLDEWKQFLHERTEPRGTLYSVYHASFRDFLHRKDIVQAAGVTIRDINVLIADDLWDGLFGGP